MTQEPVRLVVEKNVEVPMRDGVVLRADIFRAPGGERRPVIMSYGPYGKDIHFKDFHPEFYASVDERGQFMNWETANPEWWVPQGYTVVRVDERGTGRSPGRLDLFGPQEREDYYDAIEWAGQQPWSSGKVGLLGVSYYGILQWHVAAMRPPHLAAIIPWEAASDLYREFGRHGGILNNVWMDAWWARQIESNLNTQEPGRNLPADHRAHPFWDDYHAERATDLAAIEVPVLSAGNWGGYSLHLRGNIEGYLAAGSRHKWLEIHSGNHLAPFYTEESRALQKKFFDQWLKGEDSGILDTPPLKLAIRTAGGTFWRHEDAWPLPGTEWRRLHLDARAASLSTRPPATEATATYTAPTGGVLFLTEPFAERTEVTGPIALYLTISADVEDADLFASVVCLDAGGREITCLDARDRPGPVTKGWLRASHRELDTDRSLPYRPVHRHTARRQLPVGEPVEVVVEIRATSMVFEAGHRLGVAVESHDREDGTGGYYNHDDAADRPRTTLAGRNTIHTGPGRDSYLLVPVIPARGGDPASGSR